MYYNPEIPLETALEMFDDPHIRWEIIEDYHDALRRVLGRLAIPPGNLDANGGFVYE